MSINTICAKSTIQRLSNVLGLENPIKTLAVLTAVTCDPKSAEYSSDIICRTPSAIIDSVAFAAFHCRLCILSDCTSAKKANYFTETYFSYLYTCLACLLNLTEPNVKKYLDDRFSILEQSFSAASNDKKAEEVLSVYEKLLAADASSQQFVAYGITSNIPLVSSDFPSMFDVCAVSAEYYIFFSRFLDEPMRYAHSFLTLCDSLNHLPTSTSYSRSSNSGRTSSPSYNPQPSLKYTSRDTTPASSNDNPKVVKYTVLIVLAIVLLLGLLGSCLSKSPSTVQSSLPTAATASTKCTYEATTNSSMPVVDEPKSGTILFGKLYNDSEITVTASYSESCVVLVKTITGNDCLSFFVRAGETATVGVPSGIYYVYFASGKTWYGYGQGKMFGESTAYSRDSTSCDFSNYTYEYTLRPVTYGNFSETPCDADDFF